MNRAMQDIEDQNHIGCLLLDCLRRSPNEICQIDAATGQNETNASVLSRSIRLARAMRQFGLQPGDVVAFGGKNHIDLHIPLYAALLNGQPIVGVDPWYKYGEIKSLFKIARPSIAFCARVAQADYERASSDLGLNTKLLCFEDGDDSMKEFVNTYDVEELESAFKLADFDAEKIYGFLVSTSGTSGVPKVAAFKHRAILKKFLSFGEFMKKPTTERSIALNLSPAQWISGIFNAFAMPIINQTKLQTSKPDDINHLIEIINKYKPISMLLSPAVTTTLLKRRDKVDLSCFSTIIVTGAKVNPDLMSELSSHLGKSTAVIEAYGLTETMGPVLAPNDTGVRGSCGKASNAYKIKLVDPDTGLEITEPNVPGEMWVKGLCFTEYLHNPEETRNAFSSDGFFKTGDLLYRDEYNNFYFVDRIKMLIKYRNSHIVPSELEEVIMQHSGVQNVCVTAINHPEDSQHPVALVVRQPGSTVTAKEIKDLVASKLSKTKELRGGVVFCDELPMTSTGKIARGKVKELVKISHRE